MLYEIEQAVFERFPGYARMVVVAEGVDNTREIPELAELLAQQGAYSRLYLAQRQLETLEEEDA